MTSVAIREHTTKAWVREFGAPPIHDVPVLGKQFAIGRAAIRKAVELPVASPIDHREFQDDVIGENIVRSTILRRIPKDKPVGFVVSRVKPLMAVNEIPHLDLEVEVKIDDENL